MDKSAIDKAFDGSIPKIYDTLLVPLIFESYATDLVQRLGSRSIFSMLELAAGTGVLTRALATKLPPEVAIVATDLNQTMIDQAIAIGTTRFVEWKQADVMQLPFEDSTYDAVVCQFGAMFFPEKSKAFSEVHRVLKPGGVFIFNVWDRIEENEFADTITTALEAVFPLDPPRFLVRTPHGYHDCNLINKDLANAGFTSKPEIETVEARSKATSNQIPAIAYCQGTPFKNEIESRDAAKMREAIDAAAAAIGRRFGLKNVDGKIQAHVVTVEKQQL
ncbi:MAG: methyltransferase domain-containing protein [Cyclobacteriaceae bacterium]|nr:methyltransferase domain-containing protein [Cyclobacteriaceae bacterium]MDH4295139.1 methyltransferase domain-containing protein [Cyclobacteriaceae bacterium]MDH5249417.1 methyltransferase domain-containing protein [Cyclobacteriaceae bacterium]